MTRRALFRLQVLGALCVLLAAGWARGDVVVTTLANGLKACIAEDYSSDIAAIEVVVRVTADCESEDKAGLRAVVQHTIKVACEEAIKRREELSFLSDMQDAGGGVSIGTDWEYVSVGYAGVSDTASRAMEFLAEAVFKPQFTEEALVSAEEVVSKAVRETSSAPAGSTIALFRLALCGRVTRAYPLGTEKTLQNITLTDLNAFHRRFYVPALTAVVVVGPVKTTEAQEWIDRNFGDLPAGDATLPAPPAVPAESDVRVGQNPELAPPDDRRLDVASLVVGTPAPGVGDPDEAVTYVLHALLGGNGVISGRVDEQENLWDALGLPFAKGEAQRSRLIESLPPPTSVRSHLAIHAYAAPRRLEAAKQAILGVFKSLADNEPTTDELRRAKQYVLGNYSRLFDIPSNRALLIGRAVLLGQTDGNAARFSQRIMSVTPADVHRVAKSYFGVHAVGVELAEERPQ